MQLPPTLPPLGPERATRPQQVSMQGYNSNPHPSTRGGKQSQSDRGRELSPRSQLQLDLDQGARRPSNASTATLASSSAAVDRRVHALEKCIEFLKQQHAELVNGLQREIEGLKHENKELKFQLVYLEAQSSIKLPLPTSSPSPVTHVNERHNRSTANGQVNHHAANGAPSQPGAPQIKSPTRPFQQTQQAPVEMPVQSVKVPPQPSSGVTYYTSPTTEKVAVTLGYSPSTLTLSTVTSSPSPDPKAGMASRAAQDSSPSVTLQSPGAVRPSPLEPVQMDQPVKHERAARVAFITAEASANASASGSAHAGNRGAGPARSQPVLLQTTAENQLQIGELCFNLEKLRVRNVRNARTAEATTETFADAPSDEWRDMSSEESTLLIRHLYSQLYHFRNSGFLQPRPPSTPRKHTTQNANAVHDLHSQAHATYDYASAPRTLGATASHPAPDSQLLPPLRPGRLAGLGPGVTPSSLEPSSHAARPSSSPLEHAARHALQAVSLSPSGQGVTGGRDSSRSGSRSGRSNSREQDRDSHALESDHPDQWDEEGGRGSQEDNPFFLVNGKRVSFDMLGASIGSDSRSKRSSAQQSGSSDTGDGKALRVGNRSSLPPLHQRVGARALETRKLARIKQLEKLRRLQNDAL